MPRLPVCPFPKGAPGSTERQTWHNYSCVFPRFENSAQISELLQNNMSKFYIFGDDDDLFFTPLDETQPDYGGDSVYSETVAQEDVPTELAQTFRDIVEDDEINLNRLQELRDHVMVVFLHIPKTREEFIKPHREKLEKGNIKVEVIVSDLMDIPDEFQGSSIHVSFFGSDPGESFFSLKREEYESILNKVVDALTLPTIPNEISLLGAFDRLRASKGVDAALPEKQHQG